MNAADLKSEILGWLRYVRKQDIICTEVGPYNADCWGISDTRLIEVETKVTLADLRADLGKRKHQAFKAAPHLYGVPSLFYFAVPPELVDKAIEFLDAEKEKAAVASYGLLCVTKVSGYQGRQTRVVREAQKIHTRKPTPVELRVATMRMSSEICGLHLAVRTFHNPVGARLDDLVNATRLMYSEADKIRESQKENDDEFALPHP